jgi:hypothetical protein
MSLSSTPPARQETEIAPAGSDYAIGEGITHAQFGDVLVTAIDGEKLTIKFSDGRTKVIVDYYAKHRSE